MLFDLGQTLQTRGIAEACKLNGSFSSEIAKAFKKYIAGDWGNSCPDDAAANDEAITSGERILAKYCTSKGNIFIITEWDRSATTIFFADEY